MPASDDRRPPAGRPALTVVNFTLPREQYVVVRNTAAKHKQTIADFCHAAVDRHLAELHGSADRDDP